MRRPATPMYHTSRAASVNALTTEIVLELADVQELEDVRVLNASARSLWDLTLPDTVDFGRLLRLEILDISNNKLRSVDGLMQLTSLQELNLDNNYIENISSLFNTLKDLHTLHTRNNVLDNIKGVHQLKFLKTLSVSGNCLVLEEALEDLKLCLKLEKLDIDEFFSATEHIPWLKVLNGHLIENPQGAVSAYDSVLLRPLAVRQDRKVELPIDSLAESLATRVAFLEAENARLKEEVARLEDDAELNALKVEVKALRVLARENTRLKAEIQELKQQNPSKPVNSILAKQLAKLSSTSSRPQTPVVVGSITPRQNVAAISRPSTALSLPHVVEDIDEDDIDRLLEDSQRNLIEAELSLAAAEKEFEFATRANTAYTEPQYKN